MRATLTKVSAQTSKYGGRVWLLCFKCEDGKSRRSWVDPKNGNYARWAPLLNQLDISLDGLVAKGNLLIDADSFPKVIDKAPIV